MSSSSRLAAIMFSDVVGYTTLMGQDESAALKLLQKNRTLHQNLVTKYQGKLLKEMGDGMMCCFDSVSQATDAALEIIQSSQTIDGCQLRIGIHLGEVVFQNNDIFGDGVNIASRIQVLAPPQGILISQAVFSNIRNKDGYDTLLLGEKMLKNVDHPVKIYQLKAPTTQEKGNKVTPKNSLAVLPFVNMSNDPEQDYFCEGISEEIINTVVQVPEIKVAGRTSSFSFKGKNEDLRRIGNLLGVANILEGSVRKSGKRIRVTAQLIGVSTGFHLWSNKYDRELDDIFQIQDEISLEIAKQLQHTILGKKSIPKRREQTQNIEAYELYLKGRSLYYQRGKELWIAMECFQKALEIDPKYALASSGLADTYIMLSFHGYLHPEKCWEEALPAAQNALLNGPNLGEAHNTLAIIALLHDLDPKAAEKEFKQALTINPNHVQARTWYGLFYLILAIWDYEKGKMELEKAVENDPLSSYARGMYGVAFGINGDHDKNINLSEKAVALDSQSWFANFALGQSLLWGDKVSKSIDIHLAGLETSNRHSWQLDYLLQAYLKAGQSNKAGSLYNEMMDRYENQYFPPSILAMSAAALGKTEQAFELVYQAMKIKDPSLFYCITSRWPQSAALQSLPGFNEVLKELGFKDRRIA